MNQDFLSTTLQQIMPRLSATRTAKPPGPACVFKRGGALRFLVEPHEECGQGETGLKLDAMPSHDINLVSG